MYDPKLAQSVKDLCVKPVRPWPSGFPSVIWRGWSLVQGHGENVLDLSESPINDALPFCLPDLGIAQLAAITAQIEGEEENICAAYHLRWNERLNQVFVVLRETPASFQLWVDEKKLAARDLFPLLAIGDIPRFAPILNKISQVSFTKSTGSQALEWAVDLHLMGVDVLTLLNADDVYSALKRERRPVEAADIESRTKALRSWPLPSQTKAEWQTGEDLPKLEVKLQAKSPRDLSNKLKALSDVGQAWDQWEKNT
jgi:hypothetical protein